MFSVGRSVSHDGTESAPGFDFNAIEGQKPQSRLVQPCFIFSDGEFINCYR